MVPGPIKAKLGRSVQHVGKGSGGCLGPCAPCPGSRGWVRGASGGPWGPNCAFLDKDHKTKVARHLWYSMVDRVRNFSQVSASRSMAPGRFCSRGPLADWSQTMQVSWPHGNNTLMTLPPFFNPSQHDRERARRPRRGRLALHYSA